MEALGVHGTIEFRQHHATLVPASVISWVLFTQLIMEKAGHNGCSMRKSYPGEQETMRSLWRGLIDPKDERSLAVRRFYLKQARFLAREEYRPAPRFSPKKEK